MRQIESWDYTGFASHELSRDSAGLLARNVGICSSAGFQNQSCSENFCPAPDCPVTLSPGPDQGNLRNGTGVPTLSRDNRPSLYYYWQFCWFFIYFMLLTLTRLNGFSNKTDLSNRLQSETNPVDLSLSKHSLLWIPSSGIKRGPAGSYVEFNIFR